MSESLVSTLAELVNAWQERCEKQAAELTALRAEVERLRVDAERYRWLRDEAMMVDATFAATRKDSRVGRQLDAAIDAALAAKPSTGGRE